MGNQRILQFVTDGMKLDPVTPTLLQGRDSIIAAANAGGGTTADINDIWAGFAARGMGVSAQVLNAATGSVVEAFDLPGIAAAGGTLVAESMPNGRLDPGEMVTLSLCMTNNALVTSGSVTGTLMPTGGVQAPSGPQVYGTVAPAGNVCRTYSLTVGAACGATLTATLQAQEAGGIDEKPVVRLHGREPGALLQPELRRRRRAGAARRLVDLDPQRHGQPLGHEPHDAGFRAEPGVRRATSAP